MCMRHDTLQNGGRRLLGGEELLNKVIIFVFFVHKKHKIEVEPLMSHGLFYRCPYYVSGSVAVYAGSESSRTSLKYLNLQSKDESRSYGFETT